MELDRFLLSLVSALIGFLLSQSINILRYLRRPKLRLQTESGGVLSYYTGSLPDAPAEVELGFHARNAGKTPATGVKLYLLDIETNEASSLERRWLGLDTLELKLQAQFIAPHDTIVAKVATMTTFDDYVKLNSIHYEERGWPFWQIEADTREKRWFRFKIFLRTDREDAFMAGEFEVQIEEEDIHPVYPSDGELAALHKKSRRGFQ